MTLINARDKAEAVPGMHPDATGATETAELQGFTACWLASAPEPRATAGNRG